ncbi:MAG: hypothetical protein ACKPKO_40195, partial [Candidatus Fonsibacter sp.]
FVAITVWRMPMNVDVSRRDSHFKIIAISGARRWPRLARQSGTCCHSYWSDMPSVTKKTPQCARRAHNFVAENLHDNPLGVPVGTGLGTTGDGRGLASEAMTCATVTGHDYLMYTRDEIHRMSKAHAGTFMRTVSVSDNIVALLLVQGLL